MENLLRFLRQPYPYYFTQNNLAKISLGIFGLAFGFIYFFEPFDVNVEEHRFPYPVISILHAAGSAFVLYLGYSLWNRVQPREEEWKVWKEIAGLAIVLFLIGSVNFLLRELIYDNPQNWSPRYLYEEVRNAFLVGSLLILITVPLNFARSFRRHHREAETLQIRDHLQDFSSSEVIPIATPLKGEHFKLDLNCFLFAKADGNYVEIVSQGTEKSLKNLRRMSLKDLEGQLSAYPSILKTHRSYLVNVKKITKVVGNSQGYQLRLDGWEQEVPVSRTALPAFREALKMQAL